MGAWRPLKASPNMSPAIEEMKEVLARKIAVRMQKDPKCEEAVRSCLRSSRAAVFRDFKEGNGAMYGITRIGQMAEAVGLRPFVDFR